MTSETTSFAHARSARDEWRRLLAFLRYPRLPKNVGGFSRDGLRAVLHLTALDFLAMFALGFLAVLALVAGIELPENMLAELELTPLLVFSIVAGSPVIEEILFRGWLSGKPGHMLGTLLLIVGLFSGGIAYVGEAFSGNGEGIGPFVLAVTAIGVPALIWFLRGRPPARWFTRIFPAVFWLTTLLFALAHLVNFENEALLIALPLVFPQFITGALLGYARVTYGLWAAMLLHALHNGAAVCVLLAVA